MTTRAIGGLAGFVAVIAVALGALPASAAFPGANGKIAFQTNRDGNFEIYSMNADGSAPTNLTNNAAPDNAPAWSPDGTKIAFISDRDGNYEIYSMNADGSDQTRLTNNSLSDFKPAWSPDGTKIAFARSELFGQANIYVMNADGSGEAKLTNNGLFNADPAWSPDGTKIAFVRAIFGGTSEIYVINPDGSGQAQLSPSDGRLVNAPNWSPDGAKITYGGGFGFGATADVYVINADGSGRTNLTPGTPGSEVSPAWSPDGTKIAFMSDRDGKNGHIYVMNATGSGQTSLTNNPADNVAPDWQPLPSDTTPPTIALTTPADGASFLFGATVLADYSCQDEAGGSGLASCVGNVPDGAAIDTSSVGAKTFTVDAEDNAGNPTSLTHDYSVVYDFSGFSPPVDNLFTLNAVKAGRAIPVMFSLGGDQGLAIFATGYPKSEQIACSSTTEVDGIESTVTAGSSSLSYDAATDQYAYVWKTDKGWTGTCRQLVVKLNDGTAHRANFKFK